MRTATTLSDGARVSQSNLSTLCWSVSVILLSFFCLTHIGIMLGFVVGQLPSPFAAPVALFVSLAIGYWLSGREGLGGLQRFVPPAIALAVVGIALYLASLFFDMSWDGLWYHQTAVYQMAHGWNPLFDPLHAFVPHLQPWLRFYAKGPWYVALGIFESTHNIEMAKAATWIALAATFFVVLATCLDVGMRRGKATVIAMLVSLNPVITCQLASYLVDGLMVSFLACFVAAQLRSIQRPSALVHAVGVMSAILCINAKLTGVVYLGFFCAAGVLYLLILRRDLVIRYAVLQGASVLVGLLLFGFNPFVTNTVNRGNPFFPVLGSTAYPSLSQRGLDPIEMYETPHNMVGRNRFIRFAYAIFGRPGSQPFFQGENAQMMWPFDIGWKDFKIFYFHEVRISGFGPLFSGALLIGLIVVGFSLARPGMPRLLVILLTLTIVLSVLVSTHTWWARYGPQLWWLPIVAVIAGLAVPGWRFVRWAAGGLAGILLVNAVLVAITHFQWEIDATRTTYEQLSLLRGKGNVAVDFQYFGEPFGERLRNAGVTFHAEQTLHCINPMELMSVAPGYPGAVHMCVDEPSTLP